MGLDGKKSGVCKGVFLEGTKEASSGRDLEFSNNKIVNEVLTGWNRTAVGTERSQLARPTHLHETLK